MAIVAVCSPAGAACATTTALYLAGALATTQPVLLAECDASGGDLAAWAQLPLSPGWASAVAGRDRTFEGLLEHTQQLPSGVTTLVAPARPIAAAAAVTAAAGSFSPLLASTTAALTVADCGRLTASASPWATAATLTLLAIRQNATAAAPNVALVDRALEVLDVLGGTARKVGVVLVGDRPYPAAEIEQALGAPLFGFVPEDRHGAAIALGGWTLARRATRTGLGRAATTLAARVRAVVAPVPSGSGTAAPAPRLTASATVRNVVVAADTGDVQPRPSEEEGAVA